MTTLASLQSFLSVLAHVFVLILALSVYGTSRRLHRSLIVISEVLTALKQTKANITVASSETRQESTSIATDTDETGLS